MGGRILWRLATLLLSVFFVGEFLEPPAFGGPPSWWIRQHVIAEGASPDDFGLLNQGQLKQFVIKAFTELETALPEGAGPELNALVDQWTEPDPFGGRLPRMNTDAEDYAIVNLGQLKATAKVFYDRLVQAGLVRTAPWGWGPADDFAPANIGQAKALFAFESDLGADTNANGLPDLWEVSFLGYLGVDPADDPDADGLSNAEEFRLHSDPTDYFNGREPFLTLVSGNNQIGETSAPLAELLVLKVTDAGGKPLKGAPVLFEIIKGFSGELRDPVADEKGGGRLLLGVTNAEGLAMARFFLPNETDFLCLVKASAGESGAVFFQSQTMSKNSSQGGTLALRAHAPEFSLDGGAYLTNVEVQLTCGTPGAVVRFTVNGEDPTENDPAVLPDGFVEISETLVLKARAFMQGMLPSSVKSASFRIGPAISSASAHTIVLDVEGTLWSWGSNGSGQLGLGHREDQSAPVPLQRLGDVISAAAGESHGIAVLREGGRVLAWGANFHGQLGFEEVGERLSPAVVPGLPPVLAVAAGSVHSIALCKDGSVWCWGGNTNGQLGNGTTATSRRPLKVPGLRQIRAVAAGGAFSLALRADGTVWAWGDGSSGQLGGGSFGGALVPMQVLGVVDGIAISAGKEHALALCSDGSVWAWGSNDSGQIGNGATLHQSSPVPVGGLPGRALTIMASQNGSIALMSGNKIMGWGKVGENASTDSRDSIKSPQILAATNNTGVGLGALPLNLDLEILKEVGRRNEPATTGNAGVPVGESSATPKAVAPTTFEIHLEAQGDWKGMEEIYWFWVVVRHYSEPDGVLGDSDWESVEQSLEIYSAIFQGTVRDSSLTSYDVLGLEERADPGSFHGPPALSLEELGVRENFEVQGEIELEVQMMDPNFVKESRSISLNVEYHTEAFFKTGTQELVTKKAIEVDIGSVLHFRCPKISSRTFQDFEGEQKLLVKLDAVLPDSLAEEINRNYMLFVQTCDGKLCQICRRPFGFIMEFKSSEPMEYVLCPVVLLQRNYPTSSGTTDLGEVEQRAILNGGGGMSGVSTAWIRGTGEMADLEIRIGDGSIKGHTVEWAMDVRSERPERGDLDNVHLPVSGAQETLSLGSETPWKISEALRGASRFVGGLCTVSYTIRNGDGNIVCPTRQFQFRIRGKNPRDGEVISHIFSNPTYSRFAWAMVQHESRQSSKGVGRVYNQFNSGGPTRELPNFSGNAPKEDGWGISQLDKPLGKRAATGDIYNWKMNLATFQSELEQKEKTAAEYVEALRRIYAPLGIWEEIPEPFVRQGTSTPMSSLEVAVVQLYNGAAWLVEISKGKIIYDGPYTTDPHGGTRYISCWRFVPSNPKGARWEFRPNKNDYVYKVVRDEWEGNLWYQE